MKNYPNEFFYTYLWLRDDGTPYYVGKGKGRRAYVSDAHTFRRPTDSSRILVQNFPSEADAFAAEKFLIEYYGRLEDGTGCLRNLTCGGDGVPLTPAIRAKMSRSQLGNKKGEGKKRPEHVRQIMAAIHTGAKRSNSARAHMREAARNRPQVSDKTRRNMAKSHLGKKYKTRKDKGIKRRTK